MPREVTDYLIIEFKLSSSSLDRNPKSWLNEELL